MSRSHACAVAFALVSLTSQALAAPDPTSAPADPMVQIWQPADGGAPRAWLGPARQGSATAPPALHSLIDGDHPHGGQAGPPQGVRWQQPWTPGQTDVDVQGERVRLRHAVAPGLAQQISGDQPSDGTLDLVLFAEGFVDGRQDAFLNHADAVLDHLATIDPWSVYLPLINVWVVPTLSAEAGAGDELTNDVRDTAFSCAYGCGGLDRLICCDEGKIADAVVQHAPFADGVLLLVDDDQRYGGSGGPTYAVSYTGDELGPVAAHEFGHSLIGLWDEYTYGYDGDATGAPNCSPEDGEPSWTSWLFRPEIDTYAPCSFENAVRPTVNDCIMNALQPRYCAVCREQIVRRIYSELPADRSLTASPEPGSTLTVASGSSQAFDIRTLDPAEAMTWRWTLNDEVLAADDPDFRWEACSTPDGVLALDLIPDSAADRLSPEVEEALTMTVRWAVQSTDCPTCGCRSTPLGGLAFAPWLGVAWMIRRRRS